MAPPTFLQYKGHRILRLDYSGASPDAIIAYMREARPIIASEPLHSVRLLSIVAIQVTEGIAEALREFAAHNVPFVRASAIVGATPFQKSIIGLSIKSQGRLNVEMFDDEQQAKDWLATR